MDHFSNFSDPSTQHKKTINGPVGPLIFFVNHALAVLFTITIHIISFS